MGNLLVGKRRNVEINAILRPYPTNCGDATLVTGMKN